MSVVMSILVTKDQETKKSLRNFLKIYLVTMDWLGGTIILNDILAFKISFLPFRMYIYSIKSRKSIWVKIKLLCCRYLCRMH